MTAAARGQTLRCRVMDARGTAQHQLDEMQRLRAVVDARLRSPWWVHVLLAAVLAAQFTLVVMDTTWSGLASFGVVLAVLLFSLWISGRRGLRPDAPLFGRQRRNARAALLAVVFCTLAMVYIGMSLEPEEH